MNRDVTEDHYLPIVKEWTKLSFCTGDLSVKFIIVIDHHNLLCILSPLTVKSHPHHPHFVPCLLLCKDAHKTSSEIAWALAINLSNMSNIFGPESLSFKTEKCQGLEAFIIVRNRAVVFLQDGAAMAHSSVLRAVSKPFRQMLSGEMSEGAGYGMMWGWLLFCYCRH